ncbi:IS200/IS605 family element RNA-guided endonuclease TnpB [Clostridium botulinum]|uniref:Transposase n=3 Tax=Clostridium botulinum TaxID=1491 RepID=A0A9Q1UYI5_CLOBO|nr:IS200/IS605 family element RNA-guided endonuclease TnpB [Clostridium botulinum]AEB77208.1 putative IS transposase (OrfB) [Clostridium botulinum BKT015925]KEH96413.1 transposase [Clostridium botulinum C/D str. Sp77]KOA73309.1 transposase [Clostridium botulinum]KOA74755.1 transposase [Clostridium botulinum]KOA83231.1 transposase [Clostridium botulinum]
MLKAFKYRIYPNDSQKIQLSKTFGCARFIYNYYLAKKIDLYKTDGKFISKYDCNSHCNKELKKSEQFKWLKDVDKFALTNSIYSLDSAYKKFFKEHSGFPKFKSKKIHNYSYTTNFTNNNIQADFMNNKIKLPKLKWIKCKLHRKFEGKIKSATISQVPSGKYFVSILVDVENIQLPKNNNQIAFDLGIKEFLIDSNNNHIDNPKTLYKYEQKLTKLQRQIAHKEKGSQNWIKQRIKIARLHEKITNIRKDFLNKLSCQITNDYGIIISEDLNIKNMVKNHHLAKSISDVSWGEFTRQLAYKSEWKGRIYHKIDPWFASSQLCSNCGYKNKEVRKLSVREWICSECGTIHQRDENASKNILKQGLKELELQIAI